MRSKLLVGILVLAMTVSLVSLSIAAGTHIPTVEISPKRVGSSMTVFYTLTVTNTSGDSIDDVHIILPNGFRKPRSLQLLSEDGEAELPRVGGKYLATLLAGTEAKLTSGDTVELLQYATVLLPKDNIFYINGNKYKLLDNERAEVLDYVTATLKESTEMELMLDTSASLATNRVILPAGTPVKLTDSESAELQEVTEAKLPLEETAGLEVSTQMAFAQDTRALLPSSIHVKLLDDTYVLQLEPVTENTTLPKGTEVELEKKNEVILERTTEGEFGAGDTVTLPENTAVSIGARTVVGLPPETAANVISLPEGWTPLVEVNDITWTGIGENVIAAGQSMSFIFSAETADIDVENTYSWVIVTTDKVGSPKTSAFLTTVDGKKPEIDAVYLNDHLENACLAAGRLATLRVTMKNNEAASKMRTVYVWENIEDKVLRYIPMTTTDNVTWTGTFTPGAWDEKVCYIGVEDYADAVGNVGDPFFSRRFYVDSKPPILENVLFSDNAELPENTNVASWLITGKAMDNEPHFAQPLTFYVFVNAGIQDIWVTQPPYEDNSFSITLTLEEGPNLVEVWAVDFVGNEDRVYGWTFLDTILPTITIVEPAEGTVVHNLRPTISARLIDPGTVVEPSEPWTGLGIRSYELWLDDENIPFEDLVWDENTGLLSYKPAENLAENEHFVRVKASDSLNDDEFTWAFQVAGAVYDVEVSISPENKTGVIRDNLTYTVTVSNTGLTEDTYTLVATDNAGWSPTVSPSSLMIAPGASDNATLTVTIPDDAAASDVDVITVTTNGTGVSDNASCRAIVAETVFNVEVSISPEAQAGMLGMTLTYTMTIKNEGNVGDNYDLTVVDNASWELSLSENSVTLAKGASENVALTVTIPENVSIGDVDVITVTATSAETGDNASCTATVVPEYNVEVLIWPENQTGMPGTTLNYYTVTVRNTGGRQDTYTLEVTDDAGWGLDLFGNSMTIAAGESEHAFLGVTILADADDGDVDHITVTATGTGASDYATCRAIARPRVAEFTFKFIPVGENRVANFENLNIPVFTVTITVENEVHDVVVRVEVLENIEGPAPPGIVYHYMHIDPGIEHVNIKGLLTRFRVLKSWVKQNNIDKGTIRVLENVENGWQELPTSFVDEDSTYLYYEAEALGFSLFAVTGEKAAAPMIWVLVGAVVIIVAMLAVLYLWMRRR